MLFWCFLIKQYSDAKNIINNLGEKLNLRVSLIDENGYLIADSEDFELYEKSFK